MLLAVVALVLAVQPPAPPAARQSLTVSDLAWIAGHWRETGEGSVSDEVWVAPEGGAMVGTWRWVKDGKVKLFEMLAITQEESGPVLRLRHFDPRMVGWEEKDAPVTLPLVRGAGQEAVFEGPGSPGTKGLVRLTYKREGDALTVTLDKEGRQQHFRMRKH